MKKKTLLEEITEFDFAKLTTPITQELYQHRLPQGNLLINEDKFSHFCVYTLPYNPITRQVFLGHHIKADKWLVPGGHIDPHEGVKQTAIREIAEELGQKLSIDNITGPFFLSITTITNSKPPRFCTTHFDIWTYFMTEVTDFTADASEFYASSWMGIEEALALTTDQANQDALMRFNTIITQ